MKETPVTFFVCVSKGRKLEKEVEEDNYFSKQISRNVIERSFEYVDMIMRIAEFLIKWKGVVISKKVKLKVLIPLYLRTHTQDDTY